MSGTEFLTWRGNGSSIRPYRPSEGDMGGTAKENDAKYVPNPNTDPDAREWNQMVGQIAALANLIPAAIFDVRFAAGVPSIFAVYAMNPDLLASDVTVTDLGNGNVRLDVPSTKLPDARWADARPQATGNNTGLAFRSAAQQITCEIRTAGTLADVNFIAIWG
jgi:hypothetical protein